MAEHVSAAQSCKRPASPLAALPAASRARLASPGIVSRDGVAASPRQARWSEQRRSDVNVDAAATPSLSPSPDAPARWSWPPGEASARAPGDASGDTTPDVSDDDDDEPRVSPDVPCCRFWATACASARRCVHGARVVRRIHDEDGAAVDVVYSQQRFALSEETLPSAASDAPLPPPRAVAYKTYDTQRNESLEYLVQTEARARHPNLCHTRSWPLFRHLRLSALTRAPPHQLALYAEMRGRAHTIPLLDTFRDARSNPVLVLPFIADDHTPREPSAVRSYMRQLLQALAFLHDELGVMHRNIKRANVLFSGGGALTLIDFEGACHASAGALYTRFGNNLYRAPEVAAAKAAGGGAAAAYAYNAFDDCLSPCASYGVAADVFSAGAVFFELLTGARRLLDGDEALSKQYASLEAALELERRRYEAGDEAFDPRTPFAERAAQAGGPPALARLTWDAADLLRRLLAGRPERRVTAAEALEQPYFTRPDGDAADDRAFFAAVAQERDRDRDAPRRDAAPHAVPRTRKRRCEDNYYTPHN